MARAASTAKEGTGSGQYKFDIYDDASVHAVMLNDTGRTDAYLEALRSTVKADDVVVDIGTGTGILAVAAALAGAKRVYAVEAKAWAAALAERVAEVNGVGDRVKVIHGWSKDVALPEPATLLVTETLGDGPLHEHLLDAVVDAKARLLTHDARIIPQRISIYGQPLLLSKKSLDKRTFTDSSVALWSKRYGVNLSPLLKIRYERPGFLGGITSLEQFETTIPPAEIVAIDLAGWPAPDVYARAEVPIEDPYPFNAVALMWNATLANGIQISNYLGGAARTHWRPAVYLLPETIYPPAGSTLELIYQYRPNVNEAVDETLTAKLTGAVPGGA